MECKKTVRMDRMKRLKKMKRRMAVCLLAVLLAGSVCVLPGCGKKEETSSKSEKNVIRVGSKDFTEGLILGEVYALALEDAGYEVERNLNIAGSVIHTAITEDDIDVYPEYTGTALLSVLQMEMSSDADEVYDTVKKAYDEQFDITWLASSKVNDTNGLAIRKETADKYGIYSVSDLQANADKVSVCSQGEFEYREDGIPGLEQVYGKFDFKSIRVYDSGLKYQILENGEEDLCPAYSTDAQLVNTDKFIFLEDDKHFWPPYYLAPIVRNNVLEANPDIADILNYVSENLDTETMIGLNAKVDIEKQEYEEVAKEFYESIRK